MTQEENTARHSPRGACGSPAGSDGVGGFLSVCGAHGAATVRPRESGGISNPAVGKFTA